MYMPATAAGTSANMVALGRTGGNKQEELLDVTSSSCLVPPVHPSAAKKRL